MPERTSNHGDTPVTPEEVRAAALVHVANAHRHAEAAIAGRLEMIRVARQFGASWDDLATAMEMSRQLAHKRFAHLVA